MNHDSHALDMPAHARHARLTFAAQSVFAVLAGVGAIGLVPVPAIVLWVLAAMAAAGLRARAGMPVWLIGGLLWGLGAAALLQIASGTAIAGAAPLAVGLAVLLAAGGAATARDLLAFALTAAVPPAAMALSAADAAGAAAAGMLALGVVGAWLAQTRGAALCAALAREQAQRHAQATELERLEDEVQRLRLETRAAGETRESLAGELTSATQELAVLRSKAGALSNVLQRINPYDTETGLLTAEKFQNVMNREWARMRRQELPLSLLLVSIDRFDEFRGAQSRLGYEAALRRISDVLRHAGNRPGDVAARLAPGAFALLFPETEHKHVSRLAETVRTRVRQLGIAVGAEEPGKVLTATVGMATVIPNNDITPETLRERVEAALYEAQFQGGDRSVRYRTLDSIRVEHWDPEQEGQLTADGVRHKLAVLGYDATPKTYRPGEQAPSRRVPVDSVEAVVEGQLKIILEGEARVLQPGDLLFIPKGLVTSVEVVGQRPVLCLEAIRA
ncbi:MAG TPA: diguanylate cyclase [Gammaproteobacteria bacterium]|nr:diguanylate cyclase [Gammaproteobacteria bacterium]